MDKDLRERILAIREIIGYPTSTIRAYIEHYPTKNNIQIVETMWADALAMTRENHLRNAQELYLNGKITKDQFDKECLAWNYKN